MDYFCTPLAMTSLILLFYPLLIHANNNTTSAASSTTTGSVSNLTQIQLTALYEVTATPTTSVVPDVVITIAVIAGCGLLGLGIAKLGDYCYDRRMATRDDISNASEYTKNILRARVQGTRLILRTRLAVMKMKSDPPSDDGKTAKKAASAWIENTVKRVNSAKGSTQSLSVKQAEATNTDVEKADPATNGKGDDEASADQSPPTITVIPTNRLNTPSASPLPHNKVSPGDPPKPLPTMPTSSKEVQSLPSSTRGNALPPIAPQAQASKTINQPIRSTH